MKKTSFFLLISSVLIVSMFIIYGCGTAPTSSNVDSTASQPGQIYGIVQSSTGANLLNVDVSGGGKTARTVSNGLFSLNNVPSGNDILVNFSKTGYVSTQQKIDLPPGGMLYITPTLRAIGTTNSSFDPSAGGTVTHGDGSVAIKPNTLVDESGTPVTGSVTVNFTSFDPTVPGELTSFPGDFAGRQSSGGSDSPFETFGYVNISITQGGDKLNLASGSTAEVHIPIPASIRSSAPATIALWSYDEAGGYWINEGIATKEAGGTYYIAIVSHFSWWNCDHPLEVGYLKGRVVDGDGLPIGGAIVSAGGIDYQNYYRVISDAKGYFKGLVVKINSNKDVYAKTGPFYSNITNVNGNPTTLGEEYQLPSDLVISTSEIQACISLTGNLNYSPYVQPHLTGTTAESTGRFHLYPDFKNPPSSDAFLVMDSYLSFESYGFPSVVTIIKWHPGVYRYSCVYTSNTLGIESSSAEVSLVTKRGSYTFNVPTSNPDNKKVWKVFEVSVDTQGNISGIETLNRFGSTTEVAPEPYLYP